MRKPEQPIGCFDSESGLWRLTETWHAALGKSRWILVEPGFRSDGASIPRILWPFVGPRFDASTFPAAFCHDALYASELLPRRDADRIFRDHLRLLGVSKARAQAYYFAVTAFGWMVWRKHTQASISAARQFVRVIWMEDFAGVCG